MTKRKERGYQARHLTAERECAKKIRGALLEMEGLATNSDALGVLKAVEQMWITEQMQ